MTGGCERNTVPNRKERRKQRTSGMSFSSMDQKEKLQLKGKLQQNPHCHN